MVELIHQQHVGIDTLNDLGVRLRLSIVRRCKVGNQLTFGASVERGVECGGPELVARVVAGSGGDSTLTRGIRSARKILSGSEVR
jgi:hypothetical protein